MSELLENEFQCEKRAMGWNGQIIEFGKKNNLTWETSFKKLTLKVLSSHFRGKPKSKYEIIVKSIIQFKIRQIEPIHFSNQKWILNRFGKKWIQEWNGLVDLEAKWFQNIWSEKKLKLVIKINKRIQKIEDKDQIEIIAKKKMLFLVKKFNKPRRVSLINSQL
ncbi:MAG: hypothetical protein ACI85O_003234 [Saprospiraceae bacterium]